MRTSTGEFKIYFTYWYVEFNQQFRQNNSSKSAMMGGSNFK
jgi:hypothetical protein